MELDQLDPPLATALLALLEELPTEVDQAVSHLPTEQETLET